MKAFVCLTGIIVALLLLPMRQVSATSQKAYQDYLFQYDGYRSKLNNFKVARTEYLKFKTLLSETTALDTVKAMMTQRDQLLRSYLLMLTEKLNENEGLSQIDKQLYASLIANEVTFLQNHMQLIPSIAALSDATDTSKQLESHYLILNATMRQIIVALAMGELMKLNNQFKTTFTSLRDVAQINKTTVSPEKQSTIDRWILQINNKQNLYQQKIEQIILANSQLKATSDIGLDDQYVTIQKLLGEAKQYLSEGTAFMQELINLMRYQD